MITILDNVVIQKAPAGRFAAIIIRPCACETHT